MKVLVSIATYGVKNIHYLHQVINNYRSYKKYEIDISVHGTHPLDRDDVRFIKYENPKNTVFLHRKEFVEKQNDYDLYVFTEDDMLITEKSFDLYVKHDKILPANHCLGFIRFENTPENVKHLIDLWINVPQYHYISNDKILIGENYYFTVTNPHQACYLLSREKLKYVINNSDFLVNEDNPQTNSLEAASSGIFTSWYMGTGIINKVMPLNKEEIKDCLIEHLPGNHCNPPGINSNTPPEKFKNDVVKENQLFENLNLQ